MVIPFIKVNIAAAMAGLQRVRQDQIPFATAKALTNVAQAARDAVKIKLPSQFRLRNEWTERGVEATMATKANPVALVTLNRYYMYLQEQGGVKIAKRNYIAVPLDPQLRNRIPSNMRPRVLLAQTDLQGMVSGLKSQARIRAISKTYNAGFLIKSGSRLYIAIRTGTATARKRMLRGQRDPNVKILYVLVPQTKIPSRLHMHQTVEKTVRDQFQRYFAEAMDYAIKTVR
jgi:hypothetical protein